ncbi:MAG: hypothetical protein Terrestrivirus4_185 [Terrestrivirus sp.]|uniref:Uncharacterized protein n=1 Tax=Terrestrivirus sp. TaxID=2487775 RepID=A0A3G4ZMR4_9VIRU|nr:MAG: hypothetical protein Terrestrivirus4_185 [Terrestrivirus sp.]
MDQSFLSALIDVNGNTILNDTNKNEWNSIKKRMVLACNGKDDDFKELALALTKYDYNGAPSNWEQQYNHEKVIMHWTEWAFTEENYNEYKNDIKEIIKTNKKGLIPDAFRLLIDYFC